MSVPFLSIFLFLGSLFTKHQTTCLLYRSLSFCCITFKWDVNHIPSLGKSVKSFSPQRSRNSCLMNIKLRRVGVWLFVASHIPSIGLSVMNRGCFRLNLYIKGVIHEPSWANRDFTRARDKARAESWKFSIVSRNESKFSEPEPRA